MKMRSWLGVLLFTFLVFTNFLSNVQCATLTTLTGSIQFQLNAVGEKNSWIITPSIPKASKILFIFNSINMRQAEVRVYDTSAVNSGDIVFNCASCGSMLPPPFYSTTGSVTIYSTATSGVGFQSSSFSLQYIAEPLTDTNKLNNTYVTLNMGTAPIIPFTRDGYIPAGTVQQWAVRTNAQIIFSFSKFNLPSDCSAELQIHNRISGVSSSSLIFKGCRSSAVPFAWLYSKTGIALVILKTTTSATLDFQLNYISDVDMYSCGSIVQPAHLTDRSMILADGSKSTNLMQRGVSCSWLIAPSTNTPLSLVINRISLKFGSRVRVYDGSSTSANVLWDGDGATLTVPPVLTSKTNSLLVQYTSDSSSPVRYFGFEGDYSSNFIGSVGSGKGYTQLKMSSALDITPPGDGASFTPGVQYIWYVNPVGSIGPITFSLSKLNLIQPDSELILLEGASGNTGGDRGAGVAQNLEIGSRTVLATLTGRDTPSNWIRTTTSAATIIFKGSSKTVPASLIENFKLSYFSDGPNYHCGFSTNPATLHMQSFILTDGSSSMEEIYPSQYCTWMISPANSTSIVLVFDRFHVYGGFLRIYSGNGVVPSNLYAEISETTAAPAPITIPVGTVTLEYSTQSFPTGYGFQLTYYGVINSQSFPGDNLVTLTSSSFVSLTLPTNKIAPNTNLRWVITPSSSTGTTYVAISRLALSSDCSRSYVDVYDGVDTSAPLLNRYCGSSLPSSYKWLQSTSRAALVNFVSDPSTSNTGNFELAYFSDGPNFHCGFAVNPARMTAPSMVFSDGSGTEKSLYSAQRCEWLIEPNSIVDSSSAVASTRIVLEFTQCDLKGAVIEIYDGATDQATLLWRCDGCNNIPGPLISSSNKLFVRYTSESESSTVTSQFGAGFQLVYWTASANTLQRTDSTASPSSFLLQLPSDFNLTSQPDNSTAAFVLGNSSEESSLFFSPFYSSTETASITADVVDGRFSPLDFESPRGNLPMCGVLRNSGGNELRDKSLTYQSAQRTSVYLSSSVTSKTLYSISGVDRSLKQTYDSQLSQSAFSVPGVCKYRLDSGSAQAIAIKIESFSPQKNGHLIIYGGLNSEDAIIYDSHVPELYLRDGAQYSTRSVGGVVQQSATVSAPCGQATIVLFTNATADRSDEKDVVDYSLHLVYQAMPQDSGQQCAAYYASLQPSPKDDDPTTLILITLGSFFSCALVFAIFYYANKLKATQGYLFYPYGLKVTTTAPRRHVKSIVAHPRYSGKWDQYLNRFLRKGECCICKNDTQVVIRLRCGHGLCLDDVKGYLETALGNISMFPLKCPMHFQGCDGSIDARIAKRVLTEPQYNRFNEFSDRAVYGDGMRCIFCQNFVNFPDNMENISRVECPYCVQNFCVRCKKAWHSGISCAVDSYDVDLESWKNTSGAQKCPACRKLIEKDDPDTCNHMVHKITDGIPCIRERTDFCYCCGEEVTPSYPHNEVANKGVNHFPDGVFQRCRTIVKREKDAEKERLRKARRMKTKILPLNQVHSGAALDSPTTTPLLGRASGQLSIAPPGGNTALEAMWLLEQQYDIEAPVGSPSRPPSRSQVTTPLMTPSPARVRPAAGSFDGSLDSPAFTNSTARPTPSSSGRFSSGSSSRVVPASGVYTTTIPRGIAATGASSRSAASSPARPYSTLEQQVVYQQSVMAVTVGRHSGSGSGSGGSSAVQGSISSPQLLLGSPQQHHRPLLPLVIRPPNT